MTELNGKILSNKYQEHLKDLITEFKKKTGRVPGLAVILVGEDPASAIYVKNKIKACEKTGIVSFEHRLAKDSSENQILTLLEKLNQDSRVHGILVQLPLPPSLNTKKILSFIDPKKDVDALTAENMGLLFLNHPRVCPCTPLGVMALLRYYQIPIAGKKAVVVGRSDIVGKPMALLLLRAQATVTICHSKTPDVSTFTSSADLVVVATGQPGCLEAKDFKTGGVVVDVGLHRSPPPQKKLFGDVKREGLEKKLKAFTPVPGGVGPMTVTLLLENTCRLAALREGGPFFEFSSQFHDNNSHLKA